MAFFKMKTVLNKQVMLLMELHNSQVPSISKLYDIYTVYIMKCEQVLAPAIDCALYTPCSHKMMFWMDRIQSEEL